MSQLKETMKEQSSTAVEEISKTTEQETTVEDLTISKTSLPVAEDRNENTVTVEIAMATLPTNEVEVCVCVCVHACVRVCMYVDNELLLKCTY